MYGDYVATAFANWNTTGIVRFHVTQTVMQINKDLVSDSVWVFQQVQWMYLDSAGMSNVADRAAAKCFLHPLAEPTHFSQTKSND